MTPIEKSYYKCERVINTSRNEAHLDCAFKMLKLFRSLYVKEKNFDLYSKILYATLQLKLKQIK